MVAVGPVRQPLPITSSPLSLALIRPEKIHGSLLGLREQDDRTARQNEHSPREPISAQLPALRSRIFHVLQNSITFNALEDSIRKGKFLGVSHYVDAGNSK